MAVLNPTSRWAGADKQLTPIGATIDTLNYAGARKGVCSVSTTDWRLLMRVTMVNVRIVRMPMHHRGMTMDVGMRLASGIER